MQTVIVIILCAAASAWIVYRTARTFSGKKVCDCGGCEVSGCAARGENRGCDKKP